MRRTQLYLKEATYQYLKSLARSRRKSMGDQHVTVTVRVPTRLPDKQRKILQEFVLAGGDQIDPREKGSFDKLRDACGG
ncbi:MAG: hypothetical protein HYU64_21765 [Armatimonadetes bacterium]|nr:hypothetical protein [Armatimonadota bacterium]